MVPVLRYLHFLNFPSWQLHFYVLLSKMFSFFLSILSEDINEFNNFRNEVYVFIKFILKLRTFFSANAMLYRVNATISCWSKTKKYIFHIILFLRNIFMLNSQACYRCILSVSYYVILLMDLLLHDIHLTNLI